MTTSARWTLPSPEEEEEEIYYDPTTGWGAVRPILPFTSTSSRKSSSRGPVAGKKIKDVAVAIFGTHCAGNGHGGEEGGIDIALDLPSRARGGAAATR